MQEPELEVYGPPTEQEYLRKLEAEIMRIELARLRGPKAGTRKLELVEHMRLLADSSASGTRPVLLQAADTIERLSREVRAWSDHAHRLCDK
jgi:hypothetical protein